MTDIGGGFEDRDHNALMTVEELTERVREIYIFFLHYVLSPHVKWENVRMIIPYTRTHIVMLFYVNFNTRKRKKDICNASLKGTLSFLSSVL